MIDPINEFNAISYEPEEDDVYNWDLSYLEDDNIFIEDDDIRIPEFSEVPAEQFPPVEGDFEI